MTKQQLQYFLSAVESSNFSKAANFHDVSTSTSHFFAIQPSDLY